MRVGPLLGQAGAVGSASDAGSPSDKEDAKLKQACQDFEAVFVNQLLQSMRKTVAKSELFGDSREEETYQEMMDWEVARSVAKQGSAGIADMLYRQLKADQMSAERGPGADFAGQHTAPERGESR